MNVKTVDFPQEIHRYSTNINYLALLAKIKKKKAGFYKALDVLIYYNHNILSKIISTCEW